MKRILTAVIAVGLSSGVLSATGPAFAGEQVDKGAYIEEQGYGLSFDFEDPEGVELKFLSPEGKVIKDLSEYVNVEIAVAPNGTVTVLKEDVTNLPEKGDAEIHVARSATANAAACSATKTIPSKYGVITAKACKSGSKIKSSGTYKDTKADGWCLGVKAKWKPSGSTWTSGYSSRACPKGNKKSFSTPYRTGKTMDVYGIGYKAKN